MDINMAKPLQIHVSESMSELKKLQRSHGNIARKRIEMLIVIKRHESTGISKRALSDKTGSNHNSIVKWRKMYLSGGISALLVHNRKGFKPNIVNAEQHERIKEKLCDPENGLRGYVELQRWVEDELGVKIKYTTLNEYVKRHFGAKIKTARKSHIHKDGQAVEAFKKTSNK
jgi:transposase